MFLQIGLKYLNKIVFRRYANNMNMVCGGGRLVIKVGSQLKYTRFDSCYLKTFFQENLLLWKTRCIGGKILDVLCDLGL